ncbi:hypothetical protein R1sor_009625 [Riccia sorocarpa]|uniref:Transcription initiation factor TFIID subunit 15 n=1 Tax=Riccia sorocarpa TaxID=122646 RepID=A0ABD3HZ02_9MARC
MTGFGGAPPVPNAMIYVCQLPSGTDEELLAEHFGTIGLLKKDKRTGRPKIWIYRDKVTNEPKGDATVTYEDPHAASAAVEWFNNTEFHGARISVSIAEAKNKDAQLVEPASAVATEPEMLGPDLGQDPVDDYALDAEGMSDGGGAGGLPGGGGRGRGRGEPGAKAWQQEGDWPCPNPSCANINFAFRGVCNRCGTARPAGGSSGGGGGMGGGRGRGRGAGADAGRGRGPGGPPGLFGPNDWNCPMCGNINWAKRTKCNICNTTKPGHNEGGVREGRAGGYKEFDEAEIEETRRRRRELEDDDGEMYDEFGNLKKKFRLKAKLGDSAASAMPGAGKSAWDKEELGIVERSGSKEKNRDRGNKENDWEQEGSRGYSRDRDSRDRDDSGRNGHRSRDEDRNDYDKGRGRDDRERDWRDSDRGRDADRDSYRERERSRERDRDRGRGKDRDRDRDWERSRDREWPRERERVRERDRFMD